MSTLLLPPTSVTPTDESPLELQNGDRLGRSEFLRRYEVTPGVKAELIGGVVYVHGSAHMPSPIRHTHHGDPAATIAGLFWVYRTMHPELASGANATTILADLDVPQPDVYLFRPGIQATIGDDGYIYGAPELVCEIAASTASLDANDKADAYAQAGVKEYLLWRTAERPEPTIDWFQLRDDGLYHPLEPDADGVIESVVFPGLRLDRPALLRGDLPAVLAAVSAE